VEHKILSLKGLYSLTKEIHKVHVSLFSWYVISSSLRRIWLKRGVNKLYGVTASFINMTCGIYIRPFHYPKDPGGVMPKELSPFVGPKSKISEKLDFKYQ
jgi:hypothetical protein